MLFQQTWILTNAYHKIEANDLDFTLSYPLNDEMGKLCHAFEKMKDCLSKNNETMFRQFAEQRRLNAAFSHDLRTPLTLLKGHAKIDSMLKQPNCPFVLYVGTRKLVKRKEFEEYIRRELII